MKPPVETVRVNRRGKEILIKLKRQTGIENWNVLCRWALVASLAEKKHPPTVRKASEVGVEMTWKVFAGDYANVLAGLIAKRASAAGMNDTAEDRSDFLRAHITRGLDYLGSGFETKSIGAFLNRWVPGGSALAAKD